MEQYLRGAAAGLSQLWQGYAGAILVGLGASLSLYAVRGLLACVRWLRTPRPMGELALRLLEALEHGETKLAGNYSLQVGDLHFWADDSGKMKTISVWTKAGNGMTKETHLTSLLSRAEKKHVLYRAALVRAQLRRTAKAREDKERYTTGISAAVRTVVDATTKRDGAPMHWVGASQAIPLCEAGGPVSYDSCSGDCAPNNYPCACGPNEGCPVCTIYAKNPHTPKG